MTNENENQTAVQASEREELNVEEIDELADLEEAVTQHEPLAPVLPVVRDVRTLAMHLERKQHAWVGFGGLQSLLASIFCLGGVVALLRSQVAMAFDAPLSASEAVGVVTLVTTIAFLLGLLGSVSVLRSKRAME